MNDAASGDLPAIFAGIAAAAAAVAAFLHWRTASAQLRSSLFEKRLSVFQAYRDVLLLAYSDEKIPDEAFVAMKLADIPARFLFEHDALEVLERSQHWVCKYMSRSGAFAGEDLATRLRIQYERLDAGENAQVMLERLEHAFRRYLDFS